MADFTIKQGDRLPEIECYLKDATGAAVDLTGASVVFVLRRREATTATVNAAATVVGSASDGRVKYSWGASDTATTGTYDAEWQVTFSGGLVEKFPNAGHLEVVIVEKLA